ncbi:glycosyltransferase family 4 protein [Methanosarcina sp. 1.H.A.2.2]|uniref:glycosyltransferase family 4 protein n=1 Tax=Methanosarcina sp. 1.H.A.2.2 TaxID=1483601 RepID=UPI000ADD46AC|nr:glycosyltransferase family 4 protein [Methanosarcina sp. 1.H.A.2.2]
MKNKILILGPTPPPMGGIATYVEDLLKSGINEKYDLLHLNTARSLQIKKSLLKNFLLFSKNSLKLVYLLVLHKPKVVHIHTSSYLAFWEKSVFLIISKFFSAKVVLHIHGAEFDLFYNNSSSLVKFLIHKMLNSSDKVIVLSQRWNNFFSGILDDSKIAVIPNGVNYSNFSLSEDSFKKNGNLLQILFLGNLVERKGVYDILSIIPIVTSKFQNVNFVFAGSEEVSGNILKLKNECIRMEIKRFVTFISDFSNDDKIRLLREADIYLLPSYAEGLPISLLEAMAAGLPVISTPVGGIPEVVEDSVNGFLVIPGDHKDLSDKIIELIENKELRNIIGNNNREKVKEEYDWSIIAKKLEVVYTELLG